MARPRSAASTTTCSSTSRAAARRSANASRGSAPTPHARRRSRRWRPARPRTTTCPPRDCARSGEPERQSSGSTSRCSAWSSTDALPVQRSSRISVPLAGNSPRRAASPSRRRPSTAATCCATGPKRTARVPASSVSKRWPTAGWPPSTRSSSSRTTCASSLAVPGTRPRRCWRWKIAWSPTPRRRACGLATVDEEKVEPLGAAHPPRG